MGKRSNFQRRKNDDYPTPEAAILPLLPFLERGANFYEPCCGEGKLVKHLEKHGLICIGMSDLVADATKSDYTIPGAYYLYITNPPWTRELLHPIIVNLSNQRPTWLLFDADWMHTKQAMPYLERCTDIVSVGRVKWIPDSPFTGKDNCCWYRFNNPELNEEGTVFHGR